MRIRKSEHPTLKLPALAAVVSLSALSAAPLPMAEGAGREASAAPANDVVIETSDFRLTVGTNAIVKSLLVKATGVETAASALEVPLCAAVQDRPFNNEIKLIQPNKRTTYPATGLRWDGDRLIASFDHRQYEAVLAVRKGDGYAAIELEDFRCDRKSTYDYLKMDIPPVASFRILQIPVRSRKNFGDWLNAVWDEMAAVAVVGTSPYPDIDHERRGGDKILFGELFSGRKLRGAGAALIAAPVGRAASAVGQAIMWATELQPFFMGIIVSVVIGVALTLPISSAAICAALGLTGLAGGAAVAGCCAQMIGFAVMSFPENRWGGLAAQGLGTSMLQMGNIVRNPRVWIPPTLASAITGPVATCLFRLEMNGAPVSSGMGTCGLVGQIGVYTGWVSDVASGAKAAITGMDWLGLVLISFVLPAVLTWLIAIPLRKWGWIKDGDLKLDL